MRSIAGERIQHLHRRAIALARSILRHPLQFVAYLVHQCAAYEGQRSVGGGGVQRIVDVAIEERLRAFMEAPPGVLLPSRRLEDLCGPGEASGDVVLGDADGSELPEPERLAVARIVTRLQPRTVFEIGTYRGRTTRLLATCSSQATIHTLDLAPENMLEGGCFAVSEPGLIGARFRDDTGIRSRIVQHYGDSRQFDFTPFERLVDLVFVDASHSYEAVLNDSRRAFEMVKPEGLVIWDDYHPIHGPGVMRALAEIDAEKGVVWITGTRLAVYGISSLGRVGR